MRRQVAVAIGILLVAGSQGRAQEMAVLGNGVPAPVRPVPVMNGYTMPYERGCSLHRVWRWATYRPLPSPATFQVQKWAIRPQPPTYAYFIGEFGPRSPDLAYAGAVPGHVVGLPPPLYVAPQAAAATPRRATSVARQPIQIMPSWVKFSFTLPTFHAPARTTDTIIIHETPAEAIPASATTGQSLVRGMAAEETHPAVPVRDLPQTQAFPVPMPQAAATAPAPVEGMATPPQILSTEPASQRPAGQEMPVHAVPASQEIPVHQTSPSSIATPPSTLAN